MYEKLLFSAHILLVDDEVCNTQLLADTLGFGGYRNVRAVNDPAGLLSLLVEHPPDLIILDLNMPYMNGFQILDYLRPLAGESLYLPILVVSAEGSVESRMRALASGAMDYLVKPFLAEEILLRVRNLLTVRCQQIHIEEQRKVLENEIVFRTRELEDYQLDLRQAQLEVVLRLAKAAEQRDDNTGQHTQRVGLTCTLLAQSLGIPETQTNMIRLAAPLHDVGKIGIPDAILLKPGRLSETEVSVMQRHTRIGASLLSGGHSQLVLMAESIAMAHHERWDGSGYPLHLRGEDIPLEARLVATADVFDALTHSRPYKEAWKPADAVKHIARHSGSHFDPEVVDAFLTLPHGELT